MILTNAKIYTMEDKIIDNGYIIIEDALIKKIGNTDDLIIDSNETVVNLKNKSVYPGFIDAHCHIGMWEDGLGFEGDDANEETNPITPQLRAIDAINPFDYCFNEALEYGITTVVTGPGSANPIAGQWCAIKTRGEVIDDMILDPYVGMKFALGENPKTVYHGKNEAPITRMAIASLIRETLIKARHYIDDIKKASEDEDLDEPDYDMQCESLIPILKGEKKAFFHCHRADDIATAIRIKKEFNLDLVVVHGTEGYKISNTLKKENIPVVTGPVICDRSKPELKNSTPKNTGLLNNIDILTAVCTDHPVIPIQYLGISLGVCVKEGLESLASIKQITINAAKICGIDHLVGSIKENKIANLVVFNDNVSPLGVCEKPHMVILDGVIYNKVR